MKSLEQTTNFFLHKKSDKVVINDGVNWIPKDRFDEVNNRNKDLADQIADLNKELGKLKKSAEGSSELQTKIQELQDQIKIAKEEADKKVISTQKTYLLKDALRDADAKYPDLLLTKFDIDKLELDADGKLKGLDDQIKAMKESYKELFGEVKREGHDPSGGDKAVDDITEMSTEEFFAKEVFK